MYISKEPSNENAEVAAMEAELCKQVNRKRTPAERKRLAMLQRKLKQKGFGFLTEEEEEELVEAGIIVRTS